jgi:hypothetical protein
MVLAGERYKRNGVSGQVRWAKQWGKVLRYALLGLDNSHF